MRVSPIIILYTLKLHTAVCQLQLTKAEKKKMLSKRKKEKKTTSEPENQTENYPVQEISCCGELGGWVASEITAGGINQAISFLPASPLLFFLLSFYSFSPFLLSYHLCHSPMCTASTSTCCKRFSSFIKANRKRLS